MQDIYKNDAICEAIKKAITDFGKENTLNGMEFFADQLGFKGDNKAAQLHNRLSPSNNEKFLKLDEMRFMMKQMSKPQQKHIIDALANEFGFYVAKGAEGKALGNVNIEASITIEAFNIGGDFGVLSEEIAQALQDGKIDQAEAKRLKKVLKSMRENARTIEDIIDEHILG